MLVDLPQDKAFTLEEPLMRTICVCCFGWCPAATFVSAWAREDTPSCIAYIDFCLLCGYVVVQDVGLNLYLYFNLYLYLYLYIVAVRPSKHSVAVSGGTRCACDRDRTIEERGD
jgi:hypothetical protein